MCIRDRRYRNYGGATSDLQYVEYAVLAGNADADYYLSALGRSMNRFSTRFTENIYDASLSCTPQAVTSDVKSAKAEVTLTMKEDIAKFAKEMPEVEDVYKRQVQLNVRKQFKIKVLIFFC